ncbi:hypothetical protein [Cellulomonas sp. P5_C5]
MSTENTPRDGDETLALPVTDQDPTTAADDDATARPSEADDTAVLPLTETDGTTPGTDDTAVLPVGRVDETTPAADDTALLPVEEDDTTVVAPDETRSLPVTDEALPYPATSAWTSQDEPEPYTSPIGVLYAPTDRPGPAPADRVDPDAVVEAAPVVVDPPRRRLRVGTVVWGLVIAAIGVGLLAWAAGVAIDFQLAMIVLLAVAGTALLVGSIVSGARAARR